MKQMITLTIRRAQTKMRKENPEMASEYHINLNMVRASPGQPNTKKTPTKPRVETKSPKSPKSPIKAPAKSPTKAPVKSSVKSPTKAPVKSSAKSPTKTAAKSSAKEVNKKRKAKVIKPQEPEATSKTSKQIKTIIKTSKQREVTNKTSKQPEQDEEDRRKANALLRVAHLERSNPFCPVEYLPKKIGAPSRRHQQMIQYQNRLLLKQARINAGLDGGVDGDIDVEEEEDTPMPASIDGEANLAHDSDIEALDADEVNEGEDSEVTA
jgi:hypothetical protein